MQHFVYQRVHVLEGRALHLAEHLALAEKTFQQIYGVPAALDRSEIAAKIERVVYENHYPAPTSAVVMLRFAPDEDDIDSENNADNQEVTGASGAERCEVDVEFERGLLDVGYAHSSLRPRGVTIEYSMPYGGLPMQFQLSAAAFFDFLASRDAGGEGAVGVGGVAVGEEAGGALGGEGAEGLEGSEVIGRGGTALHGAVRSVRRQGDWVLSCGDAPIFAIRGRTLLTPPLADSGPGGSVMGGLWGGGSGMTGGMESVERGLVIAAAARTKSRLEVREEPISHSALKSYDELFFVDSGGIVSFSECDGAKFMCLTAPRLVLR